ncbi:hypothetical protein GCM10022243_63510 [Saccharothrix violaceirubra]|uniref:ATP-dependent Clp protease ATP-binding subunit ClpA n=1 Tax=Saccharothrix violaceirubra TaxID=413306 RepID=A0A7W7WT46_9PSEU|nr:Clp protease N-terminal domain-containing protein [Saccharothrix violaceirubra]MBB4962704.1 ATP-dependent Clp protease ATP-binding subunit ClpA [Saccharothrix violaceirubra]
MIGERLTKDARKAVRDALDEARRARASSIEPEHLLLALLDDPVLTSFQVVRADVEAAFAAARRKGGLSAADTEALRGLGIDVDRIVASVEQTMGEGALAVGPPRRRRWPRGSLPFAAGARDVLERALREARDLGQRPLRSEHLLLSLLAGGGLVEEVLAERGVTYGGIRRLVSTRPT